MLGGRRKYLPRNHEKEQPGIKWGNPSNSAPGSPDVSSQKTVNDGGKRCEMVWRTTGWHLATNLVSRAFRDCARIAAHPDVINRVAVGTIIADRPPHRTVRAALPHTAPTWEGLREVLLLAHRSILGTLFPRTVSGECWTERCSPWPAPFSPQAPPKIALLCSPGSSMLWRGPTPPERACPPSGFAPSRTGLAPLRAEAL
jgi:hypothetical protein